MGNVTMINVSVANLTRGNFSLNNNDTGQERYYFCIKTVGAELSSQSYSTLALGAWQYFIELAPFILIRKRRKKLKRNKLPSSMILGSTNKFKSNSIFKLI